MTSLLNWQDFIKQADLPADTSCLLAPNPQHALVRVSGKDAENFLHAQFSNSATNLRPGEVRFAAWCNARGRVWTLLHYWKDGESFILRMPADQVEATVKRLGMFVLRSDVQLETLSWHAAQFLGPDAHSCVGDHAEKAGAQTHSIPLPGAWPLFEVWSPGALNSDLPELPQALLALPRILSGIPEVFAEQREEWIPQMLNLDRLDGIDFKKGCYPGQEIVAKLHYKGGLKQRMFQGRLANCAAAPEAGADIFDAEGRKAGHVVEAVLLNSHCYLTAVLRLESAQSGLNIDGHTLAIETP